MKILCTTVGETAADFLNFNLNFGLGVTSVVMALLLAAVLTVQFVLPRYVPAVYWLVVILISVVGTLITDNLTDNLGVPLAVSSLVFGAALLATFAVWYAREKTLSIHSVTTRPREAFYWLVVLLTFALGTALGDLIAEQLKLGYFVSLLLFSAVIAAVYVLHSFTKLSAVLLFWIAYVMTRPLGASFGDLLSQPEANGGLGLGTTLTSELFLAALLGFIAYLSATKKDTLDQ